MRHLTINNALLTAAMFFACASPAMADGDLVPTIGISPQRLTSGQEVKVFLAVENRGDTNIPATSRKYTSKNYFYNAVDVVLSSDEKMFPGYTYTGFEPTFKEDHLLRGGRLDQIPRLAPGQRHRFGTKPYYGVTLQLPDRIPPGKYFICAVADTAENVTESNESNNLACQPVAITAQKSLIPSARERAFPKPITLPKQPINPSDLDPKRIPRPVEIQPKKP